MNSSPIILKTVEDFIRPSALFALADCPAYAAMSAAVVNAFGEPPKAAEASMGDLAHEWGESGVRMLIADIDGEPFEELADLDTVLRELDAAMREDERVDRGVRFCVAYYVRFIHDLAKKHGIAPMNILVEHHLGLNGLGMSRGGKADCILIVPFHLVIVVDLKAGYDEQDDAEDHDQIATYCTGAACDFQTPKVIGFICAPRSPREKRRTGAEFDGDALRDTAAWVQAVANRARAANPELCPGFNQCRYCRALTRCAAAKEFFMHLKEALEFIGEPTDADAWGLLASAVKLATKFGKDGNEQVKAHLKAGGKATGWKLSDTGAQRFVTNPEEACRLLTEHGHGAIARECLSMSLGDLPDEALDLIAHLIDEKDKAPSLKQDKAAKGAAVTA